MKGIQYDGDPLIFESLTGDFVFQAKPEGLQIRNTKALKGRLLIPWGKVLKWVDELWDIYDYRTANLSYTLGEKYTLSKNSVRVGMRLYIRWVNLMTFTDELWEIWDVYGGRYDKLHAL